jgi:hypothetical protein
MPCPAPSTPALGCHHHLPKAYGLSAASVALNFAIGAFLYSFPLGVLALPHTYTLTYTREGAEVSPCLFMCSTNLDYG